jgi:Fe2+ or Zn2+ uptake regulation protein
MSKSANLKNKTLRIDSQQERVIKALANYQRNKLQDQYYIALKYYIDSIDKRTVSKALRQLKAQEDIRE